MNNNSKNKDITHLATKMVVLNNRLESDLWSVANLANQMNLDTFYIFSIVMSEDFESKITEVEYPCKVKYIEVGINVFIESFLQNPNNHSFWEYNKNTLYILRQGGYSDIKEMFTIIQDTKVKLVRGSSQKSHMVSPIDFRLSCYLMILFNMNFKKVYMENSFNVLNKERYLPSST